MAGARSSLEELKGVTTVVADTGDFEAAKQYHPQDATTNPSLILAAARLPAYAHLAQDALSYARERSGGLAMALDKLIVNFGAEYLRLIPGRVSTEVDSRLSRNTEATVEKARKLVRMYEEMGFARERVLIKIASTWEGIQAARILESTDGIHCNLTLLFSLVQAVACAEAKTALISPFVGRILDWHRKSTGKEYAPAEDPGVASVREIYAYLKKFDYQTIVMGASFRNVEEILELAGIDFLTISPKLLEELSSMDRAVERKLSVEWAKGWAGSGRLSYIDSEASFRADLLKDQMASELLEDGIRRFDEDTRSLEAWLESIPA